MECAGHNDRSVPVNFANDEVTGVNLLGDHGDPALLLLRLVLSLCLPFTSFVLLCKMLLEVLASTFTSFVLLLLLLLPLGLGMALLLSG